MIFKLLLGEQFYCVWLWLWYTLKFPILKRQDINKTLRAQVRLKRFMAALLDLVSNGLWLPIKWTLPGLARVMPRIAVEVEGIHPSLLESLALHQRCSCKWSWWCSSKWTVSMWDMGQAEKQPNHLSASCQLEVSYYPARFPKRESHSELNDHHRKWVFESATCVSCPITVCKTCYRVAWKKKRLPWSNPKKRQ